MPTAGEITDFLGVTCSAAIRDLEITGVSTPEVATGDQMCFAANAEALTTAIASPCGLILAPPADLTTDTRVLEVAQPRVAFALAFHRFFSPPIAAAVHPSAVIQDDVTIGPETLIGPHVFLGKGSQIGRKCQMSAGAIVHPGTILGDRVVVQSGAVLGSTGFGYVYVPETGKYLAFPQIGRLVIGDDVEIGANTTIDRGALGETRIGRGCKIDNLVHIGHNCVVGEDVVIAAQTGLSGSVVVGNRAVIGGQVGIGDHATIGEGVILGSGSGVLTGKKLYGPGQVFWGIPAQPLKQYLRDVARFRRG